MFRSLLSKRAFQLSVLALIIQTLLTIGITYGPSVFAGPASWIPPLTITIIVLAIQQGFLILINRALMARFPGPDNMLYRLGAMLPAALLLNILALSLVYGLYPILQADPQPLSGRMGWCILTGVFINSVLAFTQEGLSNFQAWKAALTETERLSNTYQRSRIFGLRGQLNPHFLFNCFNTLSGLIHEDGSSAEAFLDQMTFVHRYLLRNDNDQLVPAVEEVKFAKAYLHLAAARFGDALKVTIDVERLNPEWKLPPLSMQVVLEDILQRNALGKSNPLSLRIYKTTQNELCVENTIHEKKNPDYAEMSPGMSNLLEKFRLLHSAGIVTKRNNSKETILLPLFNDKSPNA